MQLYVATTGRDDWGHVKPAARALWDRKAAGEDVFIPAASSEILNTRERVPVPPPQVTAEPLRNPDKIPTGTSRFVSSARKAGWDVQVTYARGPWVRSNGEPLLIDPDAQVHDTDDEESVEGGVPAQCESIAARCRKGDRRAVVIWIRKGWTKAGLRGEWERSSGHTRPSHAGGGLHDDKTMKRYLKEDADAEG